MAMLHESTAYKQRIPEPPDCFVNNRTHRYVTVEIVVMDCVNDEDAVFQVLVLI